jgi:hypothetical protein
VQVEREPGDLGVELAPQPLGRHLAEPAERSDVVAPDEDRVRVLRQLRAFTSFTCTDTFDPRFVIQTT